MHEKSAVRPVRNKYYGTTFRQILLGEKMAEENGIVIPGNATLSSQALSTWIDAIQRTSRGKHRANTSSKRTRSTAPAARTPTTSSRKRKTDGIAASAGPARQTSSTDTPLNIPYVDVISKRVGRALERQGLLVRDVENSLLTLASPEVSGFDDLLGHSITNKVRPASRPCVRRVCRQPGSCRPGNSGCGGARAKGLKAGRAGSTCRSGC